jgi:UDP-N-acetylmuramoyl-tripeptide--D-alanyl-D-alanine ligase
MMALAEAASAIGARTVGMDVTFESVSIDSRTVGSGALFVAIRGERFDGHRFVAAAAHAGAVAAMVEAPPPAAEAPDGRLALLVVDDTRRALARLAAYWRA